MVASQSNSHRAGGERQGPSKGRGKGKAAKGAMERANRPDMHGDRDDALDDGGSSQSDKDSVADVDDAEVDLLLDPPPSCPPLASVAPRRRNRETWACLGLQPQHFKSLPSMPQAVRSPQDLVRFAACTMTPPTQRCSAKKAMSCGGLTPQECKLRLKRWLVAGLDSGRWGANKRESHVSMGGVQLSHFAEGLSLEDLDRAVSHQQ